MKKLLERSDWCDNGGGERADSGCCGTAEDDAIPMVPKRYQKVEIKYSKLGVEDFDFRYYNKTNFAGLETHIPNAYCNALLQVIIIVHSSSSIFCIHWSTLWYCSLCHHRLHPYLSPNEIHVNHRQWLVLVPHNWPLCFEKLQRMINSRIGKLI